MKKLQRDFTEKLEEDLKLFSQFIHVVIGPRQVGKTTGVKQVLDRRDPKQVFYVSADSEVALSADWVLQQWSLAKIKSKKILLVIDEIQKVENWSEVIKKIWDEERSKKENERAQIILLGSSSIEVQKGLSESLAGRYLLHPVYHWNFDESQKAFSLSLEEYLSYGGYPGSYAFLGSRVQWLDYLKNSIIAPVLGKDILITARVKSPALFKQCFDLACSYAAQEISYTKLLGQLQSSGNTEQIKYYLELLEGAFLLKQLFKFSGKKTIVRSSSPKILPLCPALYSLTLDADLNQAEKGRAFEVMVGQFLSTLPGELFYWREKDLEVDYVLKFGKKIWAIEVKWGENHQSKGLWAFKKQVPSCETLLITKENFTSVFETLKTYATTGSTP